MPGTTPRARGGAWVKTLNPRGGKSLIQPSEWYARGIRWDAHLAPAVRHVVDPKLGLGSSRPALRPEERLFTALPTMKLSQLTDRKRDYRAACDQHSKIIFSSSERCDAALERQGVAKDEVRRAISALAVRSLDEEQAWFAKWGPSDREVPRDRALLELVSMCGFNQSIRYDPEESGQFTYIFMRPEEFMLGGLPVRKMRDVALIRRAPGDREDVVLTFADETGGAEEGGIAKLLGGMLMCHYHRYLLHAGVKGKGCRPSTAKRNTKGAPKAPPPPPPGRVYAVRRMSHYVSLYCLEATPEQVEAMCTQPEARWQAAGQMTLTSSVAKPWSGKAGDCGFDLLAKGERGRCIEVLARLRAHLAARRACAEADGTAQ